MSSTWHKFRAANLTTDDRQQRIMLGAVLLIVNLMRIKWAEVSIPDLISVIIQLDLILTGALGWCPVVGCKVAFKKKGD